MAKKSQPMADNGEQPLANVNTTDIAVPETMHIEAEPQKPDAPEQKNPNQEIMEKIYAKRREIQEKELAMQQGYDNPEPANDEIPVEEPLKKVKEPEQQEDSSPSETATSTVAPPAAGTELPPQPRIEKIKVEGRELEVPYETLITLAQKGLSAEQRWQEAAQLRQQAQALMTPQQNVQATQPAQQNTTSHEIISHDKLADIVKRINYGSEEEQAKALLDYGAAIEAKVRDEVKPLPTEQLIQAATQSAVTQVRFEQDQATIAKEFPEVFKDKGLSMLAGQIAGEKIEQAKQTGQYRPIIDIWRESLAETKSRYMIPQAPSNVPSPNATTVQAAAVNISDDKIERKRAAPKPPESASMVASSNAKALTVNPSSIVEKMRKSRGQPVFN